MTNLRSYPCPNCTAITGVKDSRRTADGNHVRRRRKCPDCGTAFTTIEIPVAERAYTTSNVAKEFESIAERMRLLTRFLKRDEAL